MKNLTIIDVYKFYKYSVHKKINSEYLLIWLSQFNYMDQVNFVSLFIDASIKKINKSLLRRIETNNLHNHCMCKKIYNSLDEKFKRRFNDLNKLSKCIDNRLLEQIDIKPNIINSNITEFSNTIASYIEKRSINILNPNIRQSINLNLKRFMELEAVRYHNYSLDFTLVYKYRSNLCRLLPYINIIELYILYSLKHLFTFHDIERLLPEYWRPITRNANQLKTITYSGHKLMSSIYIYHNMEQIMPCNTKTKATFQLPKLDLIYNASDLVNNENDNFIIQPNFNGYRVLISKTKYNKPIITNKHGIKISITIPIANLSFTGEFMILAYDDDKIQVPYTKISLQYKLIILDLYVWNSINLFSIPYCDRLKIIDNFIQAYNNPILIKCPTFNNMSFDILEDHYKQKLLYDDQIYFDGLIFREKFYNFQIKYKKFKFEHKKTIQINKYNIVFDVTKDIKLKDSYYFIKSAIRKENYVAYKYENDTVYLASFNETRLLVPFLVVKLDVKFIPDFKIKKTLKINNQLYTSWVIVDIHYDVNNNIVAIINRIDKTLLDLF